MSLQEFDSVILKDGRTGNIVEVLPNDNYLIELDCFFDNEGHFIGKDDELPLEFVKKADIAAKAS
jgi:hypothetical protein